MIVIEGEAVIKDDCDDAQLVDDASESTVGLRKEEAHAH
jgi:hypothetical protein